MSLRRYVETMKGLYEHYSTSSCRRVAWCAA